MQGLWTRLRAQSDRNVETSERLSFLDTNLQELRWNSRSPGPLTSRQGLT